MEMNFHLTWIKTDHDLDLDVSYTCHEVFEFREKTEKKLHMMKRFKTHHICIFNTSNL